MVILFIVIAKWYYSSVNWSLVRFISVLISDGLEVLDGVKKVTVKGHKVASGKFFSYGAV